MGAIDASAEEALRLLDRVQMVAVASHAAQYRYQTTDLLDIADKLALKEDDFVQLQLRRAVEMKDPARIISREIALKKLYLEVLYYTHHALLCDDTDQAHHTHHTY